MYHCFTDSKIGADRLETHVFISKYCLLIAKCNDLECCEPLRTDVQRVLRRKFLPAILALSTCSYLINPSRKGETGKICVF